MSDWQFWVIFIVLCVCLILLADCADELHSIRKHLGAKTAYLGERQ